jgi:hypothetical protein
MRILVFFCCILPALLLTSCFKEDEPVPPYIWNGESYLSPVSIYTSEVFINLSTNRAEAITRSDDWDLAFESAPSGYHIFLNTGNYLGATHTGTTNMSQTNFPDSTLHFTFDKSDGNPDSTAIGDWVSATGSHVYTNEVYLVGKNDGVKYKPQMKLVFKAVSASRYDFAIAAINSANQFTDVSLPKDTTCSFTYYSFKNGRTTIEPPKNEWDLVLTQYTTILYTDDGIPTPYFVRGVLLNPWHTQAALDTTLLFEGVTIADTSLISYSNARDIIGHDWKDVRVNTDNNTAEYFIRPNHTYFIRDSRGANYKLRFSGFYNESLEPGFPAFEYLKLE